MSTKKFSDAMDELDARYVEEALSYDSKTKEILHLNRRWSVVLLAAGIAVVLIGCVAVAARVFGTRLIDIFTSETVDGTDFKQSGYDLAVDIERIPMNELSEEVHQVSDAIQQQYADYQPFNNWFPGDWQTEYPTREDACSFVGCEGLKTADIGLEEQGTKVDVMGDEEGRISLVSLETGYSGDGIRAQLFSRIYTENYLEEITIGTRTTESVAFEESFYTTANNKPCQILDSSAMESVYKGLDGYIVDNGVLHNLHIIYQEKDAGQAMDILHLWADQF